MRLCKTKQQQKEQHVVDIYYLLYPTLKPAAPLSHPYRIILVNAGILFVLTAARQSAITLCLAFPTLRLAALCIIWFTSFRAVRSPEWLDARTLYPPSQCGQNDSIFMKMFQMWSKWMIATYAWRYVSQWSGLYTISHSLSNCKRQKMQCTK